MIGRGRVEWLLLGLPSCVTGGSGEGRRVISGKVVTGDGGCGGGSGCGVVVRKIGEGAGAIALPMWLTLS